MTYKVQFDIRGPDDVSYIYNDLPYIPRVGDEIEMIDDTDSIDYETIFIGVVENIRWMIGQDNQITIAIDVKQGENK